MPHFLYIESVRRNFRCHEFRSNRRPFSFSLLRLIYQCEDPHGQAAQARAGPGERKEAETKAETEGGEEMGAAKFGRRRRRRKSNSQRPRKESGSTSPL